MLEEGKTKLLVDPGAYLLDEKTIKAWGKPDFVLVTHKHQDHFDETAAKKIISSRIKFYSTKEVAKTYPSIKFRTVNKGQKFTLGKFTVEVVHAEHGYNPLLKGEKEVHEGIGFMIDNGLRKVYHTGDTICFPNNYKCDVICLPYNNHGVCMGPFEAALFAKETNPILVLPMHADSPKFPADNLKFEEELKKNELKYRFLKIGESIEL
jgi:L-ascorbate metabolism protein UlaG (beta-lactamase superfamily)